MTTPTVYASEGIRLGNLVGDVSALGLTVPDHVKAESELARRLRRTGIELDTEHNAALSALSNVPPDKFDAALARATETAAKQAAFRSTEEQARATASRRVTSAVLSAIDGWFIELVDKFNGAVADADLNTVAHDLPDFADAQSGVKVWQVSRRQSDAIEVWRRGLEQLSPLWGLYQRLCAIQGIEVGSATEPSSNYYLACMLGDPGSWGRVDVAGQILIATAQRADSAKSFGPLMPFVVPHLAGYELHLSTPEDASQVRQRVQFDGVRKPAAFS